VTGARERHAGARAILRRNARSFSWAARLMPARQRRDATSLYAWCRQCDDAVDLAATPEEATTAVVRLRAELDAVCGDGALQSPILVGLREVLQTHAIPRRFADELLDGMAMDVGPGPVRYARYEDLHVYCYRVAGTVGIMMAHLMGVRDAGALARAADLGMAMQLTNICRDVVEDEARGRVYLPAELLGGDVLPSQARARTKDAVAALLARARELYASGDEGVSALPTACAAATRAARLIYSDIGRVLERRGFDVWAGRARVSPGRKLWLALRAVVGTMAAWWLRPSTGRLSERAPS
jgi:phytoene synthase